MLSMTFITEKRGEISINDDKMVEVSDHLLVTKYRCT